MLPQTSHALQVVVELGELDLQLALRAAGVQREDVEDHARTIHHAHLERVLEAALLVRRQVVLAHQHLGVHLATQRTQLLDLPRADVGPRIGRGSVLHDLADDLDADGTKQLVHLGKLAGIGTRT